MVVVLGLSKTYVKGMRDGILAHTPRACAMVFWSVPIARNWTESKEELHGEVILGKESRRKESPRVQPRIFQIEIMDILLKCQE